MNLQNRIEVMCLLSDYLKKNDQEWQEIKLQTSYKNPWFTTEFIDTAINNIIAEFLDKEKLANWAKFYHLDDLITPQKIGIVMAGNIPLVGFHDFLSVFISGHHQLIKLSSKDDQLLTHLIKKIHEWSPETIDYISISDKLTGCYAYIATGSNQTAHYFEQYFGKYPHIIRKNKTSVAVLTGKENSHELTMLSKDIHLYFGLGCRNVTKIYVPKGYDFIPLLQSFNPYKYFRDLNKYASNYDYQLSLLLLNNIFYMSNESTLMIEEQRLFSPIGMVHYEFYENYESIIDYLSENKNVQCIIGENHVPFGQAQSPDLFAYADGIDTMEFLLTL